MKTMSYFGKTKKTEEDYLKDYPIEIGLLKGGMTIRRTCELTGTSQQTVYKLKKMFAQDCGEKARNPKGNTKGNGAGREKKPIAQYTKDGKLVKVWDSQYAAAVAFDCVGRAGWFGMCADGKMASFKGFIWKHVTSARIPKTIKPMVNRFKRKIYQYTKDGELVNTYTSVTDVLSKNPKFSRDSINYCLRGEQMTHRGYVWKSDDEPYKRVARKVSQYTKDGELVKTYDSISQACKENEGFKSGAISSCLRGISKQYKGYMWKDA